MSLRTCSLEIQAFKRVVDLTYTQCGVKEVDSLILSYDFQVFFLSTKVARRTSSERQENVHVFC